MKQLSQKIAVVVEVDLNTTKFDVKVINRSIRKGFVDVERLLSVLDDVFEYMRVEGKKELRSQVLQEQLH